MIVIISCLALTAMVKLFTADKSNNMPTVITGGILLFLISALRSVEFGYDAIRYVNRYILQSYESLSTFWFNFIANRGKDPFFYLFSRVFSALGANFQVWLAVMAAFFLLAVSRLILKYSKEPFMSYILFVSLGYFFFGLTGIRQALAMAITIFSYKYLRERKLLPFIIAVLIAALFHSSAIIFLIAYPVMFVKKIGWKQITAIIFALLAAYLFRPQIIRLIQILGWSDTIAGVTEKSKVLTISGFIIQLTIFLFCIIYRKDVLARDNRSSILYNLLFLGVVFQAMIIVVAEAFRISMYFSIFSIILIPNAILSKEDYELKGLTYAFVSIMSFAYIFYSGAFFEYMFYWQ